MTANTQVCLAFDTTGSMRSVLEMVRAQNAKIINDLFSTLPKMEMALVAIGDDLPKPGGKDRYMTLQSSFLRDWEAARRFLDSVKDAEGGDEDECYELALYEMNKLKWNPDATKVVVFIGDAFAHPVSHYKNPQRIDWRTEATKLHEKGVTIHSVQALSHYGNGKFWAELAKLGGGLHLRLDQWRHLESLLLGFTHFLNGGAKDLGTFEQSHTTVPESVRRSFDSLAGRKSASRTRRDGRKPTDPSRFQLFTCDSKTKQDVKAFAVEKGLITDESRFTEVVKGHIFYAHTERTETLRPDHVVVIQDLSTDEFFSGDSAREWLDCPYGSSKRIKPNPLGPDYKVWIQSRSHNRAILGGQEVMVEMTDDMRTAS